jgi:hypothetical protein
MAEARPIFPFPWQSKQYEQEDRQRELDQRVRELQARSLQMQLEREDTSARGSAIDAELMALQDPGASTGRKAAAYARLGELGGTRQVEGLGAIPTVVPEEQVNDILNRRTQMGAQRLASINQQIDQAKQAGDMYSASALEAVRDMQFKNVKDNFKKLPIKQAEELVEYKNLVDIGNKAIEVTSPNLYGPVAGRVQAGLAAFGQSPDFTQMNQAYSGVRNQILKARAGAAVTPSEAERFLQEIGDPYAGDYAQRLETFTSQRRKEYLDKLQAYQEAGFEIPRSLQMGAISDEGARQQQQPQAGGQSSGVVGRYSIDPSGQVIRAK